MHKPNMKLAQPFSLQLKVHRIFQDFNILKRDFFSSTPKTLGRATVGVAAFAEAYGRNALYLRGCTTLRSGQYCIAVQ